MHLIQKKSREELYRYLFLGGYGIHLEAVFRILFFPLWQKNNTDSILMWHDFSATKPQGFLVGEESRGKLHPGKLWLLDFQPSGYRSAPPLGALPSWGTPEQRMKHLSCHDSCMRASRLRHCLSTHSTSQPECTGVALPRRSKYIARTCQNEQ